MGLCNYCLGQGELALPTNNRLEEAEKGNFYLTICPVCKGTKEIESEDVFDMDDDSEEKKLLYIDDLDLSDLAEENYYEEDNYD